MKECLCNYTSVIYYEDNGQTLKELKDRVINSGWCFRRITRTGRWIMESTVK